ncbi:TPA_asm: CoA ester lyase [Salmonella enterica]|nr:CoA ester lyase [Salmonella enterica]EAO7618743.1 CoA ester lyase [Salmonella enterica]EAQ6819371.1 CoA ester lyase [Salmonella enterica]EAU9427056.1 CoA ester lyase [Salmonella enterica]EBQ2131106.1 CoA ester lyase [Salmonella enterica]
MDLLRTLLFLPGNNPSMLQNGGVFGADAVILDLEDAVSPQEKDAARSLVSHALYKVNYGTSRKTVRINPLDCGGEKDIAAIVPCEPDALILPKIDNVEMLHDVVSLIERAEKPGQKTVKIIPLLETPLSIIHAYGIATADPRVWAISFGAEDYTAALGAVRSCTGEEILSARTAIINAASAAGIDSIDTPFTDAQDENGLEQDSLFARRLGFKGKLAINPRQIDIIHQAFSPTSKDIRWAQRVVEALEQAKKQGAGVIALDGKMIDAPIVLRAERTLVLAAYLNLSEEESV